MTAGKTAVQPKRGKRHGFIWEKKAKETRGNIMGDSSNGGHAAVQSGPREGRDSLTEGYESLGRKTDTPVLNLQEEGICRCPPPMEKRRGGNVLLAAEKEEDAP